MARRNLKKWLFSGWRQWVLAVLVGLAALAVVWSLYGRTIAIDRTLAGYEEDPQGTESALLAYGLPYRTEMRAALLAGGRGFPEQFRFSRLLAWAPFYDGATLDRALSSEDPVVRRAAAMAILNSRRTAPPATVPDAVLAVYVEWAEELASPELDMGLAELGFWRDPRVAQLLTKMVVSRSEEKVKGVVPIGLANRNREVAARGLKYYVSDPQVLEALRTVASRDVESPLVVTYAIKAIIGGGYSGDMNLYWKSARSENVFVRQAIASDLENVRNPEVIPILLFLTNDENEVVRRGAVDTLMDKRAPGLLDNLEYLAEDWFASIAGDLAWAVRHYRRDDKIPYVVSCLSNTDPVVVEKALVVLFAMTRKHHGFTDEEWQEFSWDQPLMAGEKGRSRAAKVAEFMNDEERKSSAMQRWNVDYPPAYTARDRLPHLVRMLDHADSRNVRRAMRELRKITGRTNGFPPACLDPNADPTADADGVYRFMTGEKQQVIADWEKWLAENK
jgi:hypothetical protein